MNKTKKLGPSKEYVLSIIGCVLLGLFLLFIVCYSIVGSVFFSYALDSTFASVSNAPKGMIEKLPEPRVEPQWFEIVDKTKVSITSDDGYRLSAYEIENSTDNYVVLIHGYRGKSSEMSYYAKKFYEKGFNILMPDLKGHGESEGKYVGMGYMDRFDIIKWIDYLISKNNNAKIVLHGVSMGGATVCCTAGEQLPSNVVCAIEDCGYSNVYKQFEYVAENVLRLPFKKVIMGASNLVAKVRLRHSLKEFDVVRQVKKTSIPMMFIHGSADNFVPPYMLDELYSANSNIIKEKLIIDGAGHAYCATKDGELYFSSVFNFIGRFIDV